MTWSWFLSTSVLEITTLENRATPRSIKSQSCDIRESSAWFCGDEVMHEVTSCLRSKFSCSTKPLDSSTSHNFMGIWVACLPRKIVHHIRTNHRSDAVSRLQNFALAQIWQTHNHQFISRDQCHSSCRNHCSQSFQVWPLGLQISSPNASWTDMATSSAEFSV